MRSRLRSVPALALAAASALGVAQSSSPSTLNPQPVTAVRQAAQHTQRDSSTPQAAHTLGQVLAEVGGGGFTLMRNGSSGYPWRHLERTRRQRSLARKGLMR